MMPSVPTNIKCGHLGCKGLRSKLNSYCMEHGGLQYMDTKEAASVYQTAAWRTVRTVQLSRQPLCQACLIDGMVEMAQHVDHVFPWRAIGKQAFAHNLFQSLCAAHHSYKTGQEKQGNIVHYSSTGRVQYTINDYKRTIGASNHLFT
jgi:5-methylcytosine-specific restriction protein A